MGEGSLFASWPTLFNVCLFFLNSDSHRSCYPATPTPAGRKFFGDVAPSLYILGLPTNYELVEQFQDSDFSKGSHLPLKKTRVSSSKKLGGMQLAME